MGLRSCHETLRNFDGPLPTLGSLFEEARRIVDSVALSVEDHRIFRHAMLSARELLATHDLPEQPLHGDAGLGNVLPLGVWHDWEDSCRGPVIWDLASLVSTARVIGRDRERAEATLRAYGDAPGMKQIDAFVAIRGLHVLSWSLLASKHERRTRASTQARLRWLRAHPWPA